MSRCLMSAVLVVSSLTASAKEIPNPLIDYAGFQQLVSVVGFLREERRITEGRFIRMAADPRTIVLDARSAEKLALLHVKGARNLERGPLLDIEKTRIPFEGQLARN